MPYIYALRDPDTKEVRYVGKTNNLERRYQSHLCNSKNRQHIYSYRWIKSLQREGKEPILEVLEEVSEDQWKEREIWWIAEMKRLDMRLTNSDEGGGGGPREWSEESKRKLALAHRGSERTAETRARMSASMTGKKKTFNPDIEHNQGFKKGNVPHNKGKPANKEQMMKLATRHRKLTDEQMQEVRALLQEGKLHQYEIAKMFGVSQPLISFINKGYKPLTEKSED